MEVAFSIARQQKEALNRQKAFVIWTFQLQAGRKISGG